MILTRRGLMAAGGAAAVALGSCGGDTERETPERGAAAGDQEVVSFALTLEYLENDFYARVLDADIFSGGELDLMREIHANEQEHVGALETVARKLGGRQASRPRVDFASVFAGGPSRVLRVAADLENTGAGAYLGQAKNARSDEVLAAALSIHSVEARYAAALNELTGRPFAPDGAFATPLDADEVMRRVRPYFA